MPKKLHLLLSNCTLKRLAYRMSKIYNGLSELPANSPRGYPHVYTPGTLSDFIQRPQFITHMPHIADAVAALLYYFDYSGTVLKAFLNPHVQDFSFDR